MQVSAGYFFGSRKKTQKSALFTDFCGGLSNHWAACHMCHGPGPLWNLGGMHTIGGSPAGRMAPARIGGMGPSGQIWPVWARGWDGGKYTSLNKKSGPMPPYAPWWVAYSRIRSSGDV